MAKPTTFNSDLVSDVALRRVVVFVGAGASKWAKPNSGGDFKNWTQFLQYASTKAPPRIRRVIEERIAAKDYLIASEILKSCLSEKWQSILTEEFQKAADISRLHRAIMSLEQRIIVTTNFDKLIENAWSDSSLVRYPTVATRVDQQIFKLFRDNEPYLIKIHGSIDEPDNIVFDKTSFQRSAFSNVFYQDLINTLLLTHTFLFIGFSMDDPAVSLLVESHAYRFSSTRPHYAFVPGKTQPEIDSLSKTIRRLFILRYSAENNHIALAEQIETLAQAGQQRRKEAAAGQI